MWLVRLLLGTPRLTGRTATVGQFANLVMGAVGNSAHGLSVICTEYTAVKIKPLRIIELLALTLILLEGLFLRELFASHLAMLSTLVVCEITVLYEIYGYGGTLFPFG